MKFQSLFFWNHYLDLTASGIYDAMHTPFQSLFFWNHYLDRCEKHNTEIGGGFNPCFSGTTT